MIRFRCHRCKKRIAVPDGYVGRKVKCPACQIVTIVPDIQSDAAKSEAGGQGGGARQPGGSSRGAGEEAAAPAGPVEGASQAMTDELAQLAAAMGDDAGAPGNPGNPGNLGDEEQYETYEQVETYEEPAAAAPPQPAAEAPKPRARRSKSKGKSKRTAGAGRSSSSGGGRSSSQVAPPSQPVVHQPHQPAPSQPAAAAQPTDAPAMMSGADLYGGAAPSPRSARGRTPAGAGHEWIDWLAIGLQSLGGLLAAGFLYSFIKFIISLFDSGDGPKLSDMMTTGQKIEVYAMTIGVILAYLLSAFILFAAGRVCYVFKRLVMKVDRM